VKIVSSYLGCRTFQTPFPPSTSTLSCHKGWGDPGWTRLPCDLQSMDDVPRPSRYHTAVVATSRRASHLVSYLVAYLGRLQLWLRQWRITISVSKSTAVLFIKAARHIRKPQTSAFSRRASTRGRNSSLIHSLPGLHMLTRWERRQLKD
jgi:hypothetical protein